MRFRSEMKRPITIRPRILKPLICLNSDSRHNKSQRISCCTLLAYGIRQMKTNSTVIVSVSADNANSLRQDRTGSTSARSPNISASRGLHEPQTLPARVIFIRQATSSQPPLTTLLSRPRVTPIQLHTVADAGHVETSTSSAFPQIYPVALNRIRCQNHNLTFILYGFVDQHALVPLTYRDRTDDTVSEYADLAIYTGTFITEYIFTDGGT